jgi:hypothetical protein
MVLGFCCHLFGIAFYKGAPFDQFGRGLLALNTLYLGNMLRRILELMQSLTQVIESYQQGGSSTSEKRPRLNCLVSLQ